MSFAHLSHVSLILITNKIVKLLEKNIGDGLKNALRIAPGKGRRGNLNLYNRKNTISTIYEGIFTENLNLFQKFMPSYRGQGHFPSEKTPKKFLTLNNGATFRKLITTTGNEIKPIKNL